MQRCFPRASTHPQTKPKQKLQWEETKSLLGQGGENLEIARNKLIESLGTYSKFRKMRICIAFDAMGTGIDSETITPLGVTIRYCGTMEADSYIEAQTNYFLSQGHTKVIVITDDAAQKAVIDSRKTEKRQLCFVIPCSGLIKDMAQLTKECEAVFRDNMPTAGFLANTLKGQDKETFDKLNELRMGGVGGGGVFGNLRINSDKNSSKKPPR